VEGGGFDKAMPPMELIQTSRMSSILIIVSPSNLIRIYSQKPFKHFNRATAYVGQKSELFSEEAPVLYLLNNVRCDINIKYTVYGTGTKFQIT
jgi:hypothetical protein